MGLLTRHCHSNGHIFELELVDKPGCGRCKQASETASRALRDCGALATLRFRRLGQHFLKSCDFDDISVGRATHFVKCGAAKCVSKRAAQEIKKRPKCARHFDARPYVSYSVLLLYDLVFQLLKYYTRVGTLIVATIYLQLI